MPMAVLEIIDIFRIKTQAYVDRRVCQLSLNGPKQNKMQNKNTIISAKYFFMLKNLITWMQENNFSFMTLCLNRLSKSLK